MGKRVRAFSLLFVGYSVSIAAMEPGSGRVYEGGDPTQIPLREDVPHSTLRQPSVLQPKAGKRVGFQGELKDDDLFKMAGRADVEGVRKSLNEHPGKINATNEYGKTLLHCVLRGLAAAVDLPQRAREDQRDHAREKAERFGVLLMFLFEQGAKDIAKMPNYQVDVQPALSAAKKAVKNPDQGRKEYNSWVEFCLGPKKQKTSGDGSSSKPKIRMQPKAFVRSNANSQSGVAQPTVSHRGQKENGNGRESKTTRAFLESEKQSKIDVNLPRSHTAEDLFKQVQVAEARYFTEAEAVELRSSMPRDSTVSLEDPQIDKSQEVIASESSVSEQSKREMVGMEKLKSALEQPIYIPSSDLTELSEEQKHTLASEALNRRRQELDNKPLQMEEQGLSSDISLACNGTFSDFGISTRKAVPSLPIQEKLSPGTAHEVQDAPRIKVPEKIVCVFPPIDPFARSGVFPELDISDDEAMSSSPIQGRVSAIPVVQKVNVQGSSANSEQPRPTDFQPTHLDKSSSDNVPADFQQVPGTMPSDSKQAVFEFFIGKKAVGALLGLGVAGVIMYKWVQTMQAARARQKTVEQAR